MLTINERQLLQDLLREEQATIEAKLESISARYVPSVRTEYTKALKEELAVIASIKRKLFL